MKVPADGQIDYSKFTDEQLSEARACIDAQRYPNNAASLAREIHRRSVLKASAPTAPSGSTHPVRVSSHVILIRDVLPSVFCAAGLLALLGGVTSKMRFEGLLSDLPLSVAGAVFCVVFCWFAWIFHRALRDVCDVVRVRDGLVISRRRQTASILISEIESVEWLERAHAEYLALAQIRSTVPTPFGMTFRYVPGHPQHTDELIELVKANRELMRTSSHEN